MTHIRRKAALNVCCAILALSTWLNAGDAAITSVRTSTAFFNPTIGQKLSISIETSEAGNLSAVILDRDGYIVRKLASNQQIKTGTTTIPWDGKNEEKEVVPDEAYSLKLDLLTKNGSFSYFPASLPSEDLSPKLNYYDRQNRIISYSLAKPARVHIQAGSAKFDPKTGKAMGPILKTIVNREPRASGSVIDYWSGMDESGTIYVPDLPNFVTSVAATSLPEPAIITVGNHDTSFIDSLAKRHGKSLLTSISEHSHHQGLSTLDDISPTMILKPVNADWVEKDKCWKTSGKTLKIQGSLKGPSAVHFASQPGGLSLFIDGNVVREVKPPEVPFQLEVPVEQLSAGTHIVSVNWGSKYGPASANSFRIQTGPKTKSEGSNAPSK